MGGFSDDGDRILDLFLGLGNVAYRLVPKAGRGEIRRGGQVKFGGDDGIGRVCMIAEKESMRWQVGR